MLRVCMFACVDSCVGACEYACVRVLAHIGVGPCVCG